jgi:hypothetical protein
MELNRNHYFMVGLFILCLGIQFRLVESYSLNERVTKIIAARAGSAAGTAFLPSVGPTPRKVIAPPDWLGWAMMSIGSVLILHSLAMPKPGG